MKRNMSKRRKKRKQLELCFNILEQKIVTKKSPFAKKNAFFSQRLRKTTLLNSIVIKSSWTKITW